MPKKILCIGGANIDYKLKSQSSLRLATSNPIHSSFSFGGVARNVAHNLAQFSSNIYLQCVVGDDANGRKLLEHMNSLGVNTDYSKILYNQSTSQYYAILHEHGELFIGLSDMDIYNHIDDDFITTSWAHWNEQCIIFLDTNLSAQHIRLILDRALLVGAKVCIDPVSVEKSKRIPKELDSVYLLKPDRQEASALTNLDIDSVEDCIKAGVRLHERGARNVVITLGKLGYVLVNDTHQIHAKAENILQTVDVSGAGDAFVAGLLYGLQQDKPMLEACKQGSLAAAQTIQSLQTVF